VEESSTLPKTADCSFLQTKTTPHHYLKLHMPSEVFKVERPTVLREKKGFAGDISKIVESNRAILPEL